MSTTPAAACWVDSPIMSIGDLLDTTWIGTYSREVGVHEQENLIVRVNGIGEIDVNIVGHSTGSATAKIEGNLLFVTINRKDGMTQAFACTYSDSSLTDLRGIYFHYNTNPISTTAMHLKRISPKVEGIAVASVDDSASDKSYEKKTPYEK